MTEIRKRSSKHLLEIPEKLDSQLCQKLNSVKGDLAVVESALGALVVGQHYGTRVLQLMHSPATLRKYEKLIGIKYSDYCEERTTLSTRVRGIRYWDKVGGFWAIVMGKKPLKNKGFASNDKE